jgi:hypothetical protein
VNNEVFFLSCLERVVLFKEIESTKEMIEGCVNN